MSINSESRIERLQEKNVQLQQRINNLEKSQEDLIRITADVVLYIQTLPKPADMNGPLMNYVDRLGAIRIHPVG